MDQNSIAKQDERAHGYDKMREALAKIVQITSEDHPDDPGSDLRSDPLAYAYVIARAALNATQPATEVGKLSTDTHGEA